MSTASAVLRRHSHCAERQNSYGTYVYCFGGIETFLLPDLLH